MDNEELHTEQCEISRRLAARLRWMRLRDGLNQADVAEGSGIACYTYQRFELNQSKPGHPMNPTMHTLIALSRFFKVSVSDLLDFSPGNRIDFEGFVTDDDAEQPTDHPGR